jgi:predicted HAD superfamily phosphohydrolase YqeG
MQHFRDNTDSGVTKPSQVAIVGDRLLTDVMMANMMGSYGVWTRDGVMESGRPTSLVSVLIDQYRPIILIRAD